MARFRELCPVVEDHSQGLHGYDAVVRTSTGKVWFVEIKDGELPPSARKLKPSEKDAQLRWGSDYVVIKNVDEAIALARGDAFGKETA
jgi:hypothetical protein